MCLVIALHLCQQVFEPAFQTWYIVCVIIIVGTPYLSRYTLLHTVSAGYS